jgi:transposase
MSIPVALRSDYDAVRLRRLARQSKDAPQTRRLLALAVIYEGGSRTQAAEIGGVSLQTVRDWVLRFNAHGPDGLLDGKAPGQPSILSDAHRSRLSEMIESGPIPAVHGVVRWRLADLMQWLWEEYRIRISKQTLSRELRSLSFRKLSARPRHHAKSDAAVAAFKKTSPRVWRRSRMKRPAAKRGTRPSAPRDLRTASAYIFGAICPAQGKGAGLVLPRGTTEAMALHLAEISQAVAPGRHAVLLLDQAGWHVSSKLKVPANITLVPLPAKAPELNPVENIWQFLRENWISNRVFTSYTDILDHCCAAWNKLIDQPWTIMSIGLREWAHQ